jgi:hypothetical protein
MSYDGTRREVNVCRPNCAAGEFEFAYAAGELEPLSPDLPPVRASRSSALSDVRARCAGPLLLGR